MNHREGYIALMSAIIVSVMLMAVLITLNLGGYFGRFNVLNSELKQRSFSLADGCASAAVLNLAQDPSYAGSTTLAIASDTCTIFAIASGTGVIETQGIYQHAYTNLKLTVDTTTMAVTSFQEIPTIP